MSTRFSSARRRVILMTAGAVLVLGGVTACGFGEDDATASPTSAAVGASPTAASSVTAAATAVEPPPTTVGTELPTMTTAPPEPTSSPTTPPATATPSPSPLPGGGAELVVDGEPLARIIGVGEAGATLYGVSEENLLRSDDGGVTWSAVGEAQPGTLLASANDTELLYSGDRAGCGRGFSEIPYSASTDGGVTWQVIEANQGINPLHAYDANGQAVVFGTDCGLKISVDGGATWMPVADLAGEDVFALAANPEVAPQRVLVVGITEGGTGRLFMLETANIAAPALVGALTQFWANAVVDWSNDRIVLATAHHLGVSDNGGETWNWTRLGLEDVTYSVDPLTEGIPNDELNAGYGFTSVVIDPTDRNRIWLGSNQGGFYSFDGGVSWEPLGDGEQVESIVISTVSGRVFVSSGGTTRVWTLDGQ